MADRLVRTPNELKRNLIHNIVLKDLKLFLQNDIFVNVKNAIETIKRKSVYGLVAGLGDRFIYMVIKLNNPGDTSVTELQKQLKGTSSPTSAQLQKYEQLMKDTTFIQKLKEYVENEN